jgi:hypothetical protein
MLYRKAIAMHESVSAHTAKTEPRTVLNPHSLDRKHRMGKLFKHPSSVGQLK